MDDNSVKIIDDEDWMYDFDVENNIDNRKYSNDFNVLNDDLEQDE